MSRLRESTVQNKAIEYLREHYKVRYNTVHLYARKEVKTTKKYGGKRADGFLCFHSTLQKEHTISIEAKSHKTLGSLIPYWENEKFGLHFLVFGLLLSLVVLFFLPALEWYWLLLAFFTLFLVNSFLVLIIFTVLEMDHHKSLNVVRQAHQYPANEKWIVISKSSFNLLKSKKNDFRRRENQENFRRVCKRNKIGILLISRQKIEILETPLYVPGYFLESYCIQLKVQMYLSQASHLLTR